MPTTRREHRRADSSRPGLLALRSYGVAECASRAPILVPARSVRCDRENTIGVELISLEEAADRRDFAGSRTILIDDGCRRLHDLGDDVVICRRCGLWVALRQRRDLPQRIAVRGSQLPYPLSRTRVSAPGAPTDRRHARPVYVRYATRPTVAAMRRMPISANSHPM